MRNSSAMATARVRMAKAVETAEDEVSAESLEGLGNVPDPLASVSVSGGSATSTWHDEVDPAGVCVVPSSGWAWVPWDVPG